MSSMHEHTCMTGMACRCVTSHERSAAVCGVARTWMHERTCMTGMARRCVRGGTHLHGAACAAQRAVVVPLYQLRLQCHTPTCGAVQHSRQLHVRRADSYMISRSASAVENDACMHTCVRTDGLPPVRLSSGAEGYSDGATGEITAFAACGCRKRP